MATDNRRNDLIRALHGAYQNAESDLKNMRHSRDYWKNKYETRPETIGGGVAQKRYCQERIEQLEQLCRDMWTWANSPHELTEGKALHDRMEQLGLLEGESHD